MHSTPLVRLSRKTHCVRCGARKAKRWGEDRLTLTKFCPNESCTLHGLPHLVSIKTVVTIDRLGRRHVAHKEMTAPRRPFTSVPADGRVPA